MSAPGLRRVGRPMRSELSRKVVGGLAFLRRGEVHEPSAGRSEHAQCATDVWSAPTLMVQTPSISEGTARVGISRGGVKRLDGGGREGWSVAPRPDVAW